MPGLRGQLPRGQRGRPRDRRRHHGRLARADLDRGDPQHDHDRRRDDRGRGRRDRPRRESLRERLGAVEEKVQARREAGGRSPRVVGLEWLDPPFAVGHWVPEQIRRAGGWELLGADGEPSRPDDVGRGRRGRPRDAAADAVRLPPGRDRRRLGRDAASRLATRTWRPCGAARSSRSTDRPTSAGPARASSTASSCWPRSSTRTRSWTSRRSGRGRRSAEVDATGAVPRDVRLPVVRGGPHLSRPRRPRGLGAALPRLRRQGRRQRVPPVPAAPGADRARRRGGAGVATAAATADAAAPTVAAASPTGRRRPPRRRPRRRHARLLRGPGPRVRRLVPAPRPLRARRRSTTRPGTPSSMRPGAGSTSCRSHGEIVELAAGTGWWSPLLASKGELSLYDAAPAPLDRARERLVAHRLRAHLHVRDAWAEPDRPVDCRVHRFLAEPRPARPARRVPGDRPALAQAGRDVRVHRFAGRPAVERGRPSRRRPTTRSRPAPRRRPRVHDRQGLLRAGRARGGADRGRLRGRARDDDRPLLPDRRRDGAGRTRGPERHRDARNARLYSARCPPWRSPRSRRSAPASWPRR